MVQYAVLKVDSDGFEVKDGELTPEVVKNIVGGDFQFIQLVGGLGCFVLKDMKNADFNFHVMLENGGQIDFNGNALFCNFQNGQPYDLDDTTLEILARNTPTMEDGEKLLALPTLQRNLDEDYENQLDEEEWRPFKGKLFASDKLKAAVTLGLLPGEILDDSFAVNGNTLYYIPEDNDTPIYIRQM